MSGGGLIVSVSAVYLYAGGACGRIGLYTGAGLRLCTWRAGEGLSVIGIIVVSTRF